MAQNFSVAIILPNMLITVTESGICLSRPRSFAGLMNLYESNYVRFKKLAGNLKLLRGITRSEIENEAPLVLSVVERARYTTILNMTYLFSENRITVSDPNLVVRIYHDARMAEAESCNDLPRHPALKNLKIDAMDELARRWQRNMLLHKWLDYCVEQGHSL